MLSVSKFVDDGDEEAKGDEGSWRQHEEQNVVGFGQKGQAEDTNRIRFWFHCLSHRKSRQNHLPLS